MAESPAINTSPLIFLTQAGRISFLQLIAPEIIVPQRVAEEIRAYGEADATVQALAANDWLVVKDTPPVPAIIENWDLGAGESAVLSWGYAHRGTEVIIDDLAARPVLEQLRLCGMYLSDRILNQALHLVGE